MKIIRIESGEQEFDEILAVLNLASIKYSVYDNNTKVNRDIKFTKGDIVKGKIENRNRVVMIKDGEVLLSHLYGLNCICIKSTTLYLFNRISEDDYKIILTEEININNELQFYNIKRILRDNIDDGFISEAISLELKRIYYNKIS